MSNHIFPQNYGAFGTNLIFPVMLQVAMIDRANRSTPTPMYDELFDEPLHNQDGTTAIRYKAPVYLMGQYLPPSATDKFGGMSPGINGNDYDTKAKWALSTTDLAARNLILPTGHCAIQPGDRLLATYKILNNGFPGDKIMDFGNTQLIFKQVMPRFSGGGCPFFWAYYEDLAETSKIYG